MKSLVVAVLFVCMLVGCVGHDDFPNYSSADVSEDNKVVPHTTVTICQGIRLNTIFLNVCSGSLVYMDLETITSPAFTESECLVDVFVRVDDGEAILVEQDIPYEKDLEFTCSFSAPEQPGAYQVWLGKKSGGYEEIIWQERSWTIEVFECN